MFREFYSKKLKLEIEEYFAFNNENDISSEDEIDESFNKIKNDKHRTSFDFPKNFFLRMNNNRISTTNIKKIYTHNNLLIKSPKSILKSPKANKKEVGSKRVSFAEEIFNS